MARDIIDYERSLIGSLLLRPSEFMVAAKAAQVDASWFSEDRFSLMWDALDNFWRAGKIEEATPVTIRAEAKRIAAQDKERRDGSSLTAAELERMIDEAGVSVGATLRLLGNCALERKVKTIMADELPKLETYADCADGVVEIRNRLDKLLRHITDSKKIPPRAVFGEIMAEYEEAFKMRVDVNGPRNLKWTPGLLMPWPKMTAVMNGLRPGLHVVAARPSVGKTSFAVNLMRFWCETGYSVLFCSLDMPRTAVMRRFLAERSRVSVSKASYSPTGHDLDEMRKHTAALAAWPLTIVETHDIDELRTVCMVERAAGRLDILVVDYLQLLHARALGREDAVEYARISYVSDALKRLANELQIPVLALAQLNRESTKQDRAGQMPGLADLRGSGSIEQDAYTVAILHRDMIVAGYWRSGIGIAEAKKLIPGSLENPNYKYNFDDLDPVWWVLCKAQNGPIGMLPFLVRKKYFCWMLGNYGAKAITSEEGFGATKKTVVNNSPKFEKVYADWRGDVLEQTLERQGALIRENQDITTND